ncbi:polysaccharide pyruvyl transferase family protein [Paenibacillus glycinis]|uniref:Polysaccharide pyruvyl transferase domain-containing protein n=1 Tax=Paenibacillus glycinis TaxID=2697035 RepID=A0ABW9XXY2_9BACL|nr:polysaccharide pyruvyl transferase family protein [Paenibacillus glycinis]NBD27568.1 hypothetical protein [Paenibacillus glycinis]
MKRVALLTECLIYREDRTFEEQFAAVGGNTGNNAYLTALKDIFGADHLNYQNLDKSLSEDKYDVYIVGNLSWIIENKEVPSFYYDAFKKITKNGKRFVPISVGTQVHTYKSDFRYHPSTLKFLKKISEQACIACRGDYTAELLSKNGVKNVEAVGCPSMFHSRDPEFNFTKRRTLRDGARVATGITPWPNPTMPVSFVKSFFEYSIQNQIDFIEQAETIWIDQLFGSQPEFHGQLINYLNRYSKLFFDIEQWRLYSRGLDFSFSARFHGNVIPLMEGVPTLFVSIDARMNEMCEYFKFPTLQVNEFDFNWSLSELYDMADYTAFNKTYREAYRKFENLANINELKIVL